MAGAALTEEQLQQWSVDSRDPDETPVLVERCIPEHVVRLLSQHVAEVAAAGPAQSLAPALCSSLILTLRIARNFCAAGDDAVKQLQRADAASWLTSSACALLNLQPGEKELLKANTQAIANLVTASPVATAFVWQQLFPGAFSSMANSHPDLHELAGCIMYRCVSAAEGAHQDLLAPAGFQLLQSLLIHAPQDQSRLWLQHLLVDGCIVHGRLAQVQDSLPLDAQELQLHLISEELQTRDKLSLASESEAQQLAQALMELMHSAAAAAASAEVEHSQQEASMLNATMKVIRDLSGIDPREEIGSGTDVLAVMCQRGLVGELLGMLRALPPITKPSGEPVTAPAGQPSTACPSDTPYQGYRSDLVAVLANAAFGRPPVQQQISDNVGVELLLEQCQIDDANPLVKEWALWGVRNISGNAAVKQTIEQLQAQGVAASSVLEEVGVESHFDLLTKRPRIVRSKPT